MQELATSLALQLHVLFPEGYSRDDDNQRALMQSCCERLVGGAATASHHAVNDLKEAMSLAVEKWKTLQQQQQQQSTTSSSGTAKSFSFLDQFGGGFVMINIEEILEATSLSVRLEKLEKIQYLDDILPHWKDMEMILLEGLRIGVLGRNDKERMVAHDYLRLHRKWFHEGRSSPEYLDIQYQLCCNLSKCLQELIQQQEQQSTSMEHGDNNGSHQHQQQQQQLFLDLLTLWHDMFLDLMQRDCYIQGESMSEIESTFVRVLTSSSTSSSSSKAHLQEGIHQPFQILALVDRRAVGLASWIHHLSPHQVVDLCQRQNLLLKVWERVFVMKRSSSEDAHEEEDQGQEPQEEEEPAIDQASHWYALSVLTHILMQLRVSLFPWYLIGSESTTPAETARLQILARLLHDVVLLHPPSSVSAQTRSSEEWKQELCYAGIETLLSGIRGDELDKAKDMVAKLCYPLLPKVATESIQRLELILDRVDAFSSS